MVLIIERNRMVKFTLLFLLLGLYCKGQTPSSIRSDHIRIEHRGPTDKPIIPLIISTEKLSVPITELSIQVDQSTFALLTHYFKSSKHLRSKRNINEFGVFQITVLLDGEVKMFYTPERAESIHLFKNLLVQLNDRQLSDTLVKEIDKIL